jgi:WXG100 family type VII secretion target
MAFISTDVQGMVQAQNQMQSIYGQLNGAVKDLEEQQSNLAANWSGEAQSTFGKALSAFIDDFNKINSALISMMNVLGQNTNIYVNTNDTSNQLAQQSFILGGQAQTYAGATQAIGLAGL